MIKLLILLAFISSAFTREKDPRSYFFEIDGPVAELYSTKNDPPFDYFKFLNKRVKAFVEGPYVEIQSIYTYKNTMDHLVAAEFEFPLIETDISHKVEIRYQDTMRFIFDEMNSPKKEYDKENSYTKERFSYREIRAGNIQAQDTVEVIFTVMRPLEVRLNQFYELSINPSHTPRFRSLYMYTEFVKENFNIQVEIKSERPFAILANPKHGVQPKLSNHTDFYKAFYNFTMYGFYMFSGDFKIYFASTDFNAPQTIMATHPSNPHDHAFMFSLVPDMKYLPPWDWERKYLRNLSDPDNLSKLEAAIRQSEIEYFPKEFLFVIDRSDSMKGSHIEDLKKTLNKILDILSRHAPFYSILSFGSSSKLDWKKDHDNFPRKYPEDTAEIMRWVETLEADMGEKDLLSALKFAFEEYEWTQFPKNVIILTDGKVTNTDEIFQIIQANSASHKIYAIGAEQESKDLLRRIGAAGGYPIEISWWTEYFYDKLFKVIDLTFTPPEFNLAYEISCQDNSSLVLHWEEGSFDGIPKDKLFIKWMTLKNVPNIESCKAKIFYYSENRCSSSYEEIEIFRSQKAQLTDFWHKVAEHHELHYEESKRKLLVNNMQEEEPVVLNECEPQQVFSRYDLYQEQFKNLRCIDPEKFTLLSPIALSKSFFQLAQDEDESFSSRNQEVNGKENFSPPEEEYKKVNFPSLETIFFASIFILLFIAVSKIILK